MAAVAEVSNTDLSFPMQTLVEFIGSYTHAGLIVGIIAELLIILALIFVYKKFPKSSLAVGFDLAFEKVYDFFDDLMGSEEKRWLKVYCTLLFFIILLSNLFGVFTEFFYPIFGQDAVHHFITMPSGDINFNIAMALIGISIVIFEQFRSLGFGKFFYEYFPIFGKGYIPFERGNLPKYIDLPLFIFVKIFDIVISLFLGLLEIVGLLAKIISLAFRLFGNISAGGTLLVMISGLGLLISNSLLGINFPVVLPLIVYLQEILVSFIQAFVFPLLIAIFVKVAKMH